MKAVNKYRLAGFIVILVFLLFAAKDRTALGGADAGRLAVVGEVGAKGVFAITDSPLRSSDRVIFKGEKYSDKPLFLPWCAALFYRVWHNFSGWDMENDRHGSIKLLTVALNLAVDYLLFLWFFNALRRIRRGRLSYKFLLSLGVVFSTWIGSYSTVFMHHNLTALAVLGLWISLDKFSRRPTPEAALAAGAAAGLAGVVELPMGLFCGVAALAGIFVSAPAGRWLRPVLLTAAGGAFFLAVLLSINFYAYGDLRPLYIVPGGSYSPPETWKNGIFDYAADCLFRTRGIFSYQPFLLLAFPGWMMRRKKLCRGCRVMLLMIPAAMAFYIFFSSEYGGWGYGFRYYIPLIPLFFMGGCFLILSSERRFVGVLAALLLFWGVVTSMVGAVSPNCVAYEGVRTADGHFTHAIQSTFWGNVLEVLQRYAPDSAAMAAMKDHYGAENVRSFCFWQAVNLDRPDASLGIRNRDQALREMPDGRR